MDEDAAVHEVTLRWRDGRAETLRVAADETVLSAAESAGLSLPFGCRTGACATCTGRLLGGDLSHRRPPRALKDEDLSAGYALLCVAEPRADCVVEVGAAVGADLVENPWK